MTPFPLFTATISRFFKIIVFVGFCSIFHALANARQTANISTGSNFWARKQRENGVQGPEHRMARGSVGAEAPLPPRACTGDRVVSGRN